MPHSDHLSASRCLGKVSTPLDMTVLASIRMFVGEVARTASLCPERAYDLRVAVSEACANAIEHTSEPGQLTVTAWLAPERLTITIVQPDGFFMRDRARDDRAHRGMGLPLMVQLTDELIFRRLGTGGTEVVLGMSLSPA
jgi:anti-sigma regulatory factor (Ser/Thr protein kinase)